MHIRLILLFSFVYLGVIAAGLWLNVSVLCLGDPKFERGCGGLDFYLLFWPVFLLPIAGTASAIALRIAWSTRQRVVILAAASVIVVGALELSWLALPDTILSLVVTNLLGMAGLGAVAVFVRLAGRRSSARPVA